MKRKQKLRLILLSILLVLSFILVGCNKSQEVQFSLIGGAEQLNFVSDAGGDTPWGYSTGVVDYESTKCMLLLPKCEISLKVRGTLESLEYSAMIHPWVAESSDGAGFRVTVIDGEDGTIVADTQYIINCCDDFAKKQIPLKIQKEGSYILRISGNTGETNDEACDWLLFNELTLIGNFEVTSVSPPQVTTEDYLIAANYFCGGWPKTMWDCVPEDMEADFQRMLDDGFNTVIVLIPWRQFQPGVEPVSYNETAFSRLSNLMTTADNIGIKVVLRIGYFHDFYDNGDYADLTTRYSNVMIDGMYRDAFLEYAGTIYEAVASHQSYVGAFICWEDFWGVVNTLKATEDEAVHLQYAQVLGFQDYVKRNYSLAEWNQISGTDYNGYEEIPIPSVTDPSFRVFYDAYDQALNELLYDVQTVVPNASMEIRLDADLVTLEDGSQEYYSHEKTYQCEGSDYVATVYGIPMGCENKGERITAEQAMEKTTYILGNLNQKIGGKPLFVEQFLFYDDTAEFSHNARLELDQIPSYLHQVHNILRRNTCGIGIWVYQNYLCNVVYNSQFDEGLHGWATTGNVNMSSEGLSSIVLSAGSSIVQYIDAGRTKFADGATVRLRFSVCDGAVTTITASIGGDEQSMVVNGSGVYEMQFTYIAQDVIPLFIQTEDVVALDSIILYDRVQNGLLYDEYGAELDYIQDMRILIDNLKKYGAEAMD